LEKLIIQCGAGNNLRLDCVSHPSPPPPHRSMAPPIFVPPSTSHKGQGP